MSLLKKATNQEVDVKERDSLGGFQLLDTDVYLMTVKMAYIEESAKGALALNFIGETEDGREYRESLWFTNAKKETFFVNNKNESQHLPGYLLANSITMLTTQTPILECDTEVRVVKAYDADAKGEINKEVEALVDVIGQQVLVAVEKQIQNKSEKVGNAYQNTNEQIERNVIVKAFHHEKRVTLTEAMAKNPAEFIDKWLDKNKGNVINKFKEVKDAPRSGSATAGATKTEKKKSTLFDDE